ncbi:MAG: response regulator [Oscillospiraceae bacterium]|nr:response regulator [Oscillospiraceae bacterium]
MRDTGVGMTPEFLQRLFDPFSRGAGMTHVEGSGLGLSITKGLVNLMGGRISVESREHQGSTFTVELEFDAAEEKDPSFVQEESGEQLSESALAGCHLLAAEDNELNAEILRELLAIKSIRIDLWENGAEAVRAFADTSPGTYDAILMDIQMPVMNGYEATKAIRALHRADAGTIPILAMTANAFDEDRRAAEESGMNGFLSKPIQLEKMMQLLRRFVRAK